MMLKFRTPATLALALLVSAWMPSAAQARTVDLVNPEPVTINCSLSSAQMEQAIEAGGGVRDWKVVGKQPGKLQLRYIKGNNKHVITVDVGYHRNGFAVSYLDSVNLHYFINYENVARIHPRPVGWMKNLSGDISAAANALCH